MVEESVEHAFDDLRARQWIETKLRATEVLTATRKALVDCGGEIDTEYQGRVETAARDVETILAAEDPATKTGDPLKLKAAVAALDEATKPLAEILMDKAMEAMLRQRGMIS
jgi:molecular chaperone DnaK (HSP70)